MCKRSQELFSSICESTGLNMQNRIASRCKQETTRCVSSGWTSWEQHWPPRELNPESRGDITSLKSSGFQPLYLLVLKEKCGREANTNSHELFRVFSEWCGFWFVISYPTQTALGFTVTHFYWRSSPFGSGGKPSTDLTPRACWALAAKAFHDLLWPVQPS